MDSRRQYLGCLRPELSQRNVPLLDNILFESLVKHVVPNVDWRETDWGASSSSSWRRLSANGSEVFPRLEHLIVYGSRDQRHTLDALQRRPGRWISRVIQGLNGTEHDASPKAVRRQIDGHVRPALPEMRDENVEFTSHEVGSRLSSIEVLPTRIRIPRESHNLPGKARSGSTCMDVIEIVLCILKGVLETVDVNENRAGTRRKGEQL